MRFGSVRQCRMKLRRDAETQGFRLSRIFYPQATVRLGVANTQSSERQPSKFSLDLCAGCTVSHSDRWRDSDHSKAAWQVHYPDRLPAIRYGWRPTLAAFAALWGEPADGAVTTAPADQLVDDMWKNLPSWGIVPFGSLDRKLKVLTVDSQSPIRKDFDATKYPLQITFSLQGNQPSAISLPTSNHDKSN